MTRALRTARRQDGFAMVMVVAFIALLGILATSLIDIVQAEATHSRSTLTRDAAYEAAEAGIDDYIAKLIDDRLYETHFVHPGESTRQGGANGQLVAAGQAWPQAAGSTWTYPRGKDAWYGATQLGNGYEYNLEVFPPSSSSPLLRILSTGRPQGDTDRRDWRELETLVRPSSVSDFQMVADADISYGSTATTYGKIYAGVDSSGVAHSVNHGGTAYGDIYAEGSVTGNPRLMNGAAKYGAATIRTVIKTPINFNNFLASLVDIHSAAGAGGIVEDNASVNAWWLTFQSSGKVLIQPCTKASGTYALGDRIPTCTAGTLFNLPSNGAIYIGQPVIVSGQVNGRVTVGSNSDVYVGGNLSYFQSGDDVLGLVASHSVIVPQWVPANLTWRAAVIAQSGTFRSYGSDPQTHTTEPDYVGDGRLGTMTFTGATATYGGGSMGLFGTRVYQYDSTLLYLPPPWFPTIQDAFTIVLAREVAAGPN
jgi:Tfp pilus assembly protein PilX